MIRALLLLLLPLPALAQPERYELGQRLKAFEAAWEKQPDAASRKKALAIVEKVTKQFFSFQLGEAGRTLDEARWALEGREPSDAEKWLTSLYMVPEKRAYDFAEKQIKVTVKHFYKTTLNMPKDASVWLCFPGGSAHESAIAKLPMDIALPVVRGSTVFGRSITDEFLQVRFNVPSVVIHRQIGLSFLRTQSSRFDKAPNANSELAAIVGPTHKHYLEVVKSLQDGDVYDTDVPGATLQSLLSSLQLLSPKTGEHAAAFHTMVFPGQQGYLAVLVGKSSIPVRVLFPTRDKNTILKPPPPIVVALHGAGGSENMFFESYGAGHIVKECEKRGWVLVAPRSPLQFVGAPPIDEILKQLAEVVAFDPERVFVVGHSMGAGQAIAYADTQPKGLRGVAALGGGGRVTKPDAFKNLPTFIGVGDKDFALNSAKALAKAIPTATYKEYPDFEHLVIVREALPDVFKMWDDLAKPK